MWLQQLHPIVTETKLVSMVIDCQRHENPEVKNEAWKAIENLMKYSEARECFTKDNRFLKLDWPILRNTSPTVNESRVYALNALASILKTAQSFDLNHFMGLVELCTGDSEINIKKAAENVKSLARIWKEQQLAKLRPI